MRKILKIDDNSKTGFHSMALLDFVVRKEAWEGLTLEHQTIVLSVIKDWELSLDQIMDKDKKLVIERLKTQGVTLHRWDKEELKKARSIAIQIWNNYGLKSPHASTVIEQLKSWFKLHGNI